MAELPLSPAAALGFPLHLLLPLSTGGLGEDAAEPVEHEPDADECFVRGEEPPALPPDPFAMDGVLRKGLGRRTVAEVMDQLRDRWASLDDEHQRSLVDRRLRSRLSAIVSDEPEPDSY